VGIGWGASMGQSQRRRSIRTANSEGGGGASAASNSLCSESAAESRAAGLLFMCSRVRGLRPPLSFALGGRRFTTSGGTLPWRFACHQE